MDEIIRVAFSPDGRAARTSSIWQYDRGRKLQITGLELPASYEVQFSNCPHATAKRVVVYDTDTVEIPEEFTQMGEPVYAYIYIVGDTYGITERLAIVPVKKRGMGSDEEPDPQEVDTIDTLINALNGAVAQTAQDVADTTAAKEAAEAAAEAAENYSNIARQHAEDASASKDAAQIAQTGAETAKADAETAAASANASATDAILLKNQAELAAQNAEESARISTEAVQTNIQLKNQAQLAERNASQYASTAEAAKTDAEAARDTAVAAAVHSPKIEDGTWHVWDQQSNDYVDTDVEAQGQKGDPGDDYVLTEEDKDKIAELAADKVDLSDYAKKTDTVLETTLSRGRKAESVVGKGSFAFGNNVEASGSYSHAEGTAVASGSYSHAEGTLSVASGSTAHAEGNRTVASGTCSHAEGSKTIANAAYSHVEGKYNIEDSIQSWSTWTPNTEYAIGDKVKMLVVNSNNETSFNGYICKIANNDADFVAANWAKTNSMNYAYIIGNGTTNDARSNAYALDWDGNGKYAGDVYVHSNSDSSGGDKLATEDYVDDVVSHIHGMTIHICTAQEYDAQTGIPTIANPDATTFYLVPGGDAPNLYIEWIYTNNAWEQFGSASIDLSNYVQDVQVNGTSVVTDGVANVPVAANGKVGVTRPNTDRGLQMVGNSIGIISSSIGTYRKGTSVYFPVTIGHQHESTFYGLAKAAGSDEKDSTLPVGQYTESAKSAISTMLNGPVTVSGTTPSITALSGIQYVCGEVATLDITLPASGCVDVVFESGSTPTVLTVTPPTGVTVKWANGFDPTALEANTTYEINIKDGLGVAASWT